VRDNFGKACGGQIDGILGIDLLEKMGLTIDLQRSVAQFGDHSGNDSEKNRMVDFEASMGHCVEAFNAGRAEELRDCFDSEIVLYTSGGEFRGRDEVLEHLNKRFLYLQPHPHFEMTIRDMRLVGDAVWHGFDYRIESSDLHIVGRGMMICRRNGGRWQFLNMHNSVAQPELGG